MSKLLQIAANIRREGIRTNTADFLEGLDKYYTLRKHGVKNDLKNKFDDAGNPIPSVYHPHFPITASEYARTKKVYSLFAKMIDKYIGKKTACDSEVYRRYILLLLEHAAREMKISGSNVEIAVKMMLPLPTNERISKKNSKKNSKKGNN